MNIYHDAIRAKVRWIDPETCVGGTRHTGELWKCIELACRALECGKLDIVVATQDRDIEYPEFVELTR